MSEHASRSLSHRAVDALAIGRSRLVLHGVDRLGARPRVRGAPYVENLGRIEIGDDFTMLSGATRAHLVTARGAVLRIGDGVTIGAGAAIAASTTIEIGDGAHLGRSVMLMDSDYHDPDRRSEPGASAPIVIGAGAHVGDRVLVAKGARIGRGAYVAAGSTVSGIVGDGAEYPLLASPLGTRAVEDDADALAEEICRVLDEALAMPRPLRPDDHPSRLDGWDSLVAVRMLVSLEAAFGVALPAEAVARAPDVAAIAEIVSSRLTRSPRGSLERGERA